MSEKENPAFWTAMLGAVTALINGYVTWTTTKPDNPISKAVDAVTDANEVNRKIAGDLNERFKRAQDQLDEFVASVTRREN